MPQSALLHGLTSCGSGFVVSISKRMVLWSEALYSLSTLQFRTCAVRPLVRVTSMCVCTIFVPLFISNVGALPLFSTLRPYCSMKSSKFAPLVFVSGPYRVLCALLSTPIITGYPFNSIISSNLSSQPGWTSSFTSRYKLTMMVCLPPNLVSATAQSLLHQLSMAVRPTSRLATMPALGAAPPVLAP